MTASLLGYAKNWATRRWNLSCCTKSSDGLQLTAPEQAAPAAQAARHLPPVLSVPCGAGRAGAPRAGVGGKGRLIFLYSADLDVIDHATKDVDSLSLHPIEIMVLE